MSEKQITARVRDIKQEDVGIFRVELVAETVPDPRGLEVIRHPIQAGDQRMGYEQLPQSLGHRRAERPSRPGS